MSLDFRSMQWLTKQNIMILESLPCTCISKANFMDKSITPPKCNRCRNLKELKNEG